MQTRIEIRDRLLENADSTFGFELEPPEPLRVMFSYGGAVTASYMDYANGLFNIIKSLNIICIQIVVQVIVHKVAGVHSGFQ